MKKVPLAAGAALLALSALFAVAASRENASDTAREQNSLSSMNTLKFTLTSGAFKDGESIPPRYTCDGDDINPPLEISGVPEDAQSLVLIMDDPDAVKPAGKVWDHWVVFNIQHGTRNTEHGTLEIPEGIEPEGTDGNNSWGRTGYGGPCPPDGEHRYAFKLYALDIALNLAEGAAKSAVETAMGGHILAEARLTGLYERQQ